MRYAAIVIAMALLTRLAVVLWLHETVPYTDFVLYHAAGIETARDPGFLFGRAGAARLPQINLWPPGYPLFLAGVYAFSGPYHRHAVFLQVLLGVLVCWIVFRIVMRSFGMRTGFVAGLLVAVHPHLVFLTNQLASENLYLVWFALALHLASRLGAESCVRRHHLFLGLALGLGALTRAVGLVAPIVIVAWWRQRAATRRAWGRGALWLLLGTAAVVLPWTIRNLIVTGHPALVCSGGGLNFYFGHNPDAIGYRDLAETPLQNLRDPAAIDAAGYRLGLQWIAADPWGFVGRGLRKIVALYGFPDYALHVNSGILVPDSRTHPELAAAAQAKLARQRERDRLLHGPLMHTARAYHLFLLVLAALGSVLWCRQKAAPPGQGQSPRPGASPDRIAAARPAHDGGALLQLCTGFVLAWTAAHVLFWAQPRFRHPLELPLAVLAAFALTPGIASIPRRHERTLATSAARGAGPRA